MAWLEVDRLHKNYLDFRLEADFVAAQGEIVAILGPSGAGKSTLLRLLAGLQNPDGGEIRMAGRNVAGLSPRQRGIGLVFQDFALFPHYSVAQNIAYGLKVRHLPRTAQAARVDELLQRFALHDFGSRRIGNLSGGEKQRVALARALAVEPELMLFDEPLGSLDAALRRELRSELRLLQRELGYTSISVTHDQEDALAVSDRLLVMRDGRIVQSGSPEEIYQRPVSSFVASFFGDATLLPVLKVAAAKGQAGMVVTTAWGPMQVDSTTVGGLELGGEGCSLFIRSERIRVLGTADEALAAGVNRIRVQVADCEYRGRGYLVAATGGLHFWLETRPRIGEFLVLELPVEDILLLGDA